MILRAFKQDIETFQDSSASISISLPQGVVEEKEIKKISFSELSSFGESVSISDEFAVIGEKGDNSNTGSVFIYQKSKNKDEDWVLIKKLTAPDGEIDDNFGQSLSISKDIIVVGSVRDYITSTPEKPGSVYVFQKNKGGENNWGEIKKIIPSDSEPEDHFGIAVSLDGDTLVVGKDDVIMGPPGAAYVFERHYGGTDNWGQIKKLIASDIEDGDYFGHSVSISGDTIVVSSPFDDDEGFNSGSAYIYQRNEGGLDNWGETKKITSPDGNTDDEFGYALSITGANIIISAASSDNWRGSAYIFHQNKGGFNNWGFVQKLIAYDRKLWYWFGTSVCIANDTAIVYSSGNDSAYIFKKNKDDTDNWQLQKKLIPSDYSPENKSGKSSSSGGTETAVSMSSENIVIGRSGGDMYINRGVYIYKNNTGY